MFASDAAFAQQIDAVIKRLDLAQAEVMRNPATAISGAKAARAAAMESPPSPQRTIALARADWIWGVGLAGLNKPKEALSHLRGGLAGGILQIAPKSKPAGDLFMGQAVALLFDNDVEQALPSAMRAFEIYRALGDRRSQAIALQTIGSIYLVARDFDRALRYYQESAETFAGDPALTISLLNNRASAFMEQGRYAAAATAFDQALARARAMKSDVLKVRFLASKARAELASDQLDRADSDVREAFALSATAPVGDWMPALYWTNAEIARKRGQLDLATRMIERTFKGVDLDRAPLAMRDYLRSAYEIYKARGDRVTALRYLEAFKHVDDQSRAVAASAAAALMSARFDYQGQQSRIEQLRANEREQAAAADAKLRSTLLNAVLVAASLIVGLLTVAYVSIRRSRNEVRAANADLSTTNVQLERALAARTEFLAMTSHEIRTPLNGILGMTQVLLADRAIEQGVRGKIELVHGAGETMKTLVDDLLDVAKMTNGEIVIHKEAMDLAGLLRELGQVWAAQAQTRGIALAIDTAALPRRIVEDAVRLRQIIANLMANAIKFTDKGEVQLTGAVAQGTIDGAGERLRIAITDTGIGIPDDALETIFESFRQVDAGVTRRHAGTGLGLAICRSLARAMGGDVYVESIVGVGSTFTLDLPLERVAAAAPGEAAPAGLASARLLLVEANPLTQSVLRAVFASRVAEILVARNDEDARAAIVAERPDIVLADGAALGGDVDAAIRLGQFVRDHGARCVVTWTKPEEEVRAALDSAELNLIAKPIAPPDLAAAVDTFYSDPAASRAAACVAWREPA